MRWYIILILLLVGCSSLEIKGVNNDVKDLGISEIREYEGKKLSSVTQFRENSIKGVQYIDIDNYTMTIDGLVENSMVLSYNDIVNGYQNYKKIIRLDCVEGWSATILWEGIIIREMLEKARPLPNATIVIFYAQDGYTTSFPIEYIMDNDLLLAYKMNDAVMIPDRGYPFQLVAESKWGYKWIKWITKIEFTDNDNYEGFWESRGYSNSADLNDSFFDNR